jgi:hypothetical protein
MSKIDLGAAEAEWAGIDLGDARLNARAGLMVQRALEAPAESFPNQAKSVAELEAMYRFYGNERVTGEGIISPHVAATVERMEGRARVLVAHDTTENRFQSMSEDLGQLSCGGRGFISHVALAIAPGEAREPLGVLHIENIVRQGEPKRRSGIIDDPERESMRWHRGVESVAPLAPAGTTLVHLMDREGDAYPLLSMMVEGGHSFVVRALHDRATSEGRVRDLLEGQAVLARREVQLSARAATSNERKSKRYPAREARIAHVEIRAKRVRLLRPAHAQDGLATLELNLVVVTEPNPPKGEPPVEWRLWTTLPIVTAADALEVVDCYRSRWVIEEYFRALKSGCSLAKRQLESAHGLQNVQALFAPIAWMLLRLRSIARATPDAPGSRLLSPVQLKLLRMLLKRRKRVLSTKPTAREVMLGIAALGGHIPNNGDPGWIVLGRGLEDLLRTEQIMRALSEM